LLCGAPLELVLSAATLVVTVAMLEPFPPAFPEPDELSVELVGG